VEWIHFAESKVKWRDTEKMVMDFTVA